MSAIMEAEMSGVHEWPQWFCEQQCEAAGEYEAAHSPTRTDEAWRFSDLSEMDLSSFVSAGPVSSEGRIINASLGLDRRAARMVFGNNTLLHREAESLAEGVVLTSLDVAAREHEELFREYFMAQPIELGSHKFAALHRSKVATGAFLHVPDNVEVELPVEIFHWVEGENASVYPHTLIVCGKNSKVTVIDNFRSTDGHPAFACAVNDLHLAPGARLIYASVQDWSRETLAFHLNATHVSRDASSTAVAVNFGGRFIRAESLSRLAGPGSRSEMFSLNPIDGERQIDQRTLQDHVAPDASSDLLYLNSLDDVARSIFAGLIKVQPGAHRTDAYQKVRNLMLSDSAEANSMPGLEILADDVRCTHGATSGEINDEELFYLAARGIPKTQGRKLIINGFFQTLIERITDPELRKFLSAMVADRMGS